MPILPGSMCKEGNSLSNSEIEERAQSLIYAFGRKFGLVTEPAVPVERIAEDYLRIRCLPGDLHVTDRSAQMSTSFFERIITVAQETSHNGSYTHAIAHSIGHWLLHRGEFLSLPFPLPEFHQKGVIVCREGAADIQEDQADRFAASLIMPVSLLKMALKNVRLDDEHEIKRLAMLFDTKVDVVLARLNDLGLKPSERRGQLSFVFGESTLCAGQNTPASISEFNEFLPSADRHLRQEACVLI